MRILSRKSINKASPGESIASGSQDENVAEGSQGSVASKQKRRLFARSRRSESSPRMAATSFRTGRKEMSPTTTKVRSKSAPRSMAAASPSSVNRNPERQPTIVPPSQSLQLLASLAIDAQLPGSAEVSFSHSYDTPEHCGYDSVRRQLFPDHEDDDDNDHDYDMKAPLLSSRQEHHTIDISSLAMTRAATVQSTEVYCVVEQDHNNTPKRVWETLFQHVADDDSQLANDSPKTSKEAKEVQDCAKMANEEDVTPDDDIEMTMSILNDPEVTMDEATKLSSVDDILQDLQQDASPLSTIDSHECDVVETKDVIRVVGKDKAIEIVPLEDMVESESLPEQEVMQESLAGVSIEVPAPGLVSREQSLQSKTVDIAVEDGLEVCNLPPLTERRRSADEPDEQPPRRSRSLADDSETVDDPSTSPSSVGGGFRHHISVVVHTVDSNKGYPDGQEEKKEDADVMDVVHGSTSISSLPSKPEFIAPNVHAERNASAEYWEKYAKDLVQQCVQSDTATKVMRFLRCGNDVTMPPGKLPFDYDRICNTGQFRQEEEPRPLYDEAFTLEFLKTMMTDGVTVFSLQAPESRNNPTSDWNGRAVNMVIEPGTSQAMRNMEPKLEWTILPGGRRFEVYTTSVALLSIHSISSIVDADLAVVNSDKVYFSITTDEDVVHVFEANSPEERDRIVNGLRNVLARLAYHLIVGDPSAALGLYHDDQALWTGQEMDGEICPSPDRTMNQMAHLLLD